MPFTQRELSIIIMNFALTAAFKNTKLGSKINTVTAVRKVTWKKLSLKFYFDWF